MFFQRDQPFLLGHVEQFVHEFQDREIGGLGNGGTLQSADGSTKQLWKPSRRRRDSAPGRPHHNHGLGRLDQDHERPARLPESSEDRNDDNYKPYDDKHWSPLV